MRPPIAAVDEVEDDRILGALHQASDRFGLHGLSVHQLIRWCCGATGRADEAQVDAMRARMLDLAGRGQVVALPHNSWRLS